MSLNQAVSELRPGAANAPSVVILGSPRCGTTSVATWLTTVGLGVGVKDSFYLMDHDAGLRGPTHMSTHGVAGYLRLFPSTTQPTVECAAGYLYQRQALDFFSQWAEPPQFIVIAREPIARLRSVHRYFTGNLGVLPRGLTFEQYVDALFEKTVAPRDWTVSNALDQGLYASALDPWVSRFGYDHIHLVDFEHLTTQPTDVVRRIVDWAGASAPPGLDDMQFAARNQSHLPGPKWASAATSTVRALMPRGELRSRGGELLRRVYAQREHAGASEVAPPHDATTVDRLRDFYAEPNAQLANRFKLNLSRWTVA